MKEYGEPPRALLGAGIVDDLPALYRTLAGGDDYVVHTYVLTWSEKLARWLTLFSPLLLAVGGMLLFIEFKTPGFGAFGIGGIACLLVVFFGHYVAGLSGHEAVLVFLLGAALVFLELFLFPGTVVVALMGAVLMLGSLLWGMADIWPGQPSTLDFDPGVFVRPIINLSSAIAIATVLTIVLLRFIPSGWLWDRLVLQTSVTGVGSSPESTIASGGGNAGTETLIGATGRAVTGLFPSGEIDVNGRRVQARVEVGSASAGASVRVLRRADFVYVVEVVT
jgi:membrane-bound serine protease (ClpP class)